MARQERSNSVGMGSNSPLLARNVKPKLTVLQLKNEINTLRSEFKDDIKNLSKDLHQTITTSANGLNRDEGSALDSTRIMEKVHDDIQSKLQKFEKEWASRLTDLDERISEIEYVIDEVINDLDICEQYSRKNCLILHGIPESEKENPFITVVDFFNKHFETSFLSTDFDNVHRLGYFKMHHEKPRPLVVKFIRFSQRDKIFRNKRILKGTGYGVAENITWRRRKLLQDLQKKNFQIWTVNGDFVVLLDSEKKNDI